jgi:alkylation response protein AidB-like acyl-CoA dehydrogenase
MHQPGVEVRGIRSMAGASGFNEVFFTDAVVPDAMRVGEVGEGWRVANATLMNERVSIGSEVAPQGSGPIARAVQAFADYGDGDAVQRDRLVRLWVDAEVLRLGSLRAQAKREKGVPGPEGSILKLLSGRVLTDVSELVVDLMGPAGTVLDAPYTRDQVDESEAGRHDAVLSFVSTPAATIAGGTTQIQMNIIGERVLGLPREPGLDPDTPWSQIPRN